MPTTGKRDMLQKSKLLLLLLLFVPTRLYDTIAYENIQFLFIDKGKILRYKSIFGTCSLDTITHSRTDFYINLSSNIVRNKCLYKLID